MSAYMPLIKLTQRRKDAKVLRLFYYGRTTGHDIKPRQECGRGCKRGNPRGFDAPVG
jgi:hypothetical protein